MENQRFTHWFCQLSGVLFLLGLAQDVQAQTTNLTDPPNAALCTAQEMAAGHDLDLRDVSNACSDRVFDFCEAVDDKIECYLSAAAQIDRYVAFARDALPTEPPLPEGELEYYQYLLQRLDEEINEGWDCTELDRNDVQQAACAVLDADSTSWRLFVAGRFVDVTFPTNMPD